MNPALWKTKNRGNLKPQLILQLKLFYTTFIAPPKEWQLPKKADILIFDSSGSEVLMPYLKKYSVTVLAKRGEVVSVLCLLRAILKLDFWKGKPLRAYSEVFIQLVAPKIVLTFIDNNTAFYEISKRFPDIRTIFIQNGTRGESGDILGGLEKSDNYHVDYMLVHGSAIGNHYLKYISGQSIPIGSLINNTVEKLNKLGNNNVLFISQWFSEYNDSAPFYIKADGKPISWKQLYEAEAKVLKFLDKWCSINHKYLKICARSNQKEAPEKEFYKTQLNYCEWEYIPRTDNISSYMLIDAAEIVVSIDSTLGYESIARGKKTAALTCRGSSILAGDRNFGWPTDLPNNGPFWTNDQNEVQFQRVMDYLNVVDDDDWEHICQLYARELIEFDPGNTRFVALLDKLLPNSKVKFPR